MLKPVFVIFYGLFINKPTYVGMLKPVDIKHYFIQTSFWTYQQY